LSNLNVKFTIIRGRAYRTEYDWHDTLVDRVVDPIISTFYTLRDVEWYH